MMKKLLLIITLFAGFQAANAQNEAIFNHYIINPILINPAAAGFEEYHKVHFNARTQWTGFEGAPTTLAATYNGPISKTFGFGAMVFNEEIASLTRTRAQLDFAFRYQFEKMRFAFGFATEWTRESVPNSVLENPEIWDPSDFVLSDAADGVSSFDASLGAFAVIKEKTTLGMSFPNLITARTGDIASESEQSSLFEYYTIFAGHRFGIEGQDFELEPSLLIKSLRDTPLQVDFNIKANLLQERITTGLSYRSGTGGALGLLLGTKINALRIYYSYDVAFQRFQRYNSGSHELTLGLDFGKSKDRAAKHR